MKTSIEMVEISRLRNYLNPNYLDYYNPEDVAFMLMALTAMSAKYEILGFINPHLNGGQMTIRFLIEPCNNAVNQGYDLRGLFEFMKGIIEIDEIKKTEFQSYVDDISDLFNLGGGFEDEDEDLPINNEMEIYKD
ncbi:MAG: hypothetical protein ABL895_12645 [Cyclobacteriaceae bacterium]